MSASVFRAGAFVSLVLLCAPASSQTAAPRLPPGTLSPRDVPVDARDAAAREQRRVDQGPSQERRLDPRDPTAGSRISTRVPEGDHEVRLKAEREARRVAPEPLSPNRLADPGRSRPLGDDAGVRRRAP